nr:Chain G, Pancreas/duodenum homeobox protein 1 [Homo sapiens]
PEQDCAVTSGE